MNAKQDKLIKCNFTLEELEYFSTLMVREQTLWKWVSAHLNGLGTLGVSLPALPLHNVTGKLMSYIRKAG